MIAVSSSGKSFRALASYLVSGRTGEEQDRVAWTSSRNLPTSDPELAATFMRATASQSNRVEKPVYHIALSFDPGDQVNQVTMEAIADRLLQRLGLAEHQVVIVAHRDRQHPHLHLFINRIHPDSGKAWERWKDQPLIQQVLREEERRLGLREVPGRFARYEQGELALDRSGKKSMDVSSSRGSQTAGVRRTALVDELKRDLQAHDKVAELSREHYTAKLDVDATQARQTQLDLVIERASAAEKAFLKALGAVYRDPTVARESFGKFIEDHGVKHAVETMRSTPERFGELVAVESRRALGLVHVMDDTQARNAAPTAARLGELGVAADRAELAAALDARVRRLEDAFVRELGMLYQNPAEAKAAFEALARRQDLQHAGDSLGERPHELGSLRHEIAGDAATVSSRARSAGAVGIEASRARSPTQVGGAPTERAVVSIERTASREDVERATQRERVLYRDLASFPSSGELEYRIGRLSDRLLPREVRQLARVVTAPQAAFALSLRSAARDVLLGREEEARR